MEFRRAKPDDVEAIFREYAVVVLVSANVEWAAVKEFLGPERLEPTPYGEFFTRVVGNEDILFLHGGWGKIAAAGYRFDVAG